MFPEGVAPLQWNFSFSFGDLATLLSGIGTVLVAISALMVAKKQTQIMEWHKDRALEEKRMEVFEFKRKSLSSAYTLCVAVRNSKEADAESVDFLNSKHLLLKEYFKEDTAVKIRNVLAYYNMYTGAEASTQLDPDAKKKVIHTCKTKIAEIIKEFYIYWDEVTY